MATTASQIEASLDFFYGDKPVNAGAYIGRCENCDHGRKTFHGCNGYIYSYWLQLAHHETRMDVNIAESYIMLDYPLGDYKSSSRTTARHKRALEFALSMVGDYFTSIGSYGGYRINHALLMKVLGKIEDRVRLE